MFTEEQKSTMKLVFAAMYHRNKKIEENIAYCVKTMQNNFFPKVSAGRLKAILDALAACGYLAKTMDEGLTWYNLTAKGIARYEAAISLDKEDGTSESIQTYRCMECKTEVTDGENGWVEFMSEENRIEALCDTCDDKLLKEKAVHGA